MTTEKLTSRHAKSRVDFTRMPVQPCDDDYYENEEAHEFENDNINAQNDFEEEDIPKPVIDRSTK